MTETKRCVACEADKPATLEFFYERKDRSTVFQGKCKECQRKKRRVYAENYRELHKNDTNFIEKQRACKQRPEYMEARREYEKLRRPISRVQETNRRIQNPIPYRVKSQKQRAKRAKSEGTFDLNDVLNLFKAQNAQCFYCKKVVGRKAGPWEIDHFIPLSRGGSNYPNNLRLACKACNRIKHDKLPHEFMPEKFSPPQEQAAD